MMLKFRAWDKYEKTMLDVHGINFDEYGVWTRELIDDEDDGGFILTEDVKLLQYTGLKDVHGVEIFEGDIVKVNVLEGIGPNASIVFKYGMFGVENDMHGYGYDKGLYSLNRIINRHEVEVIGNIFENPELLEEIE